MTKDKKNPAKSVRIFECGIVVENFLFQKFDFLFVLPIIPREVRRQNFGFGVDFLGKETS